MTTISINQPLPESPNTTPIGETDTSNPLKSYRSYSYHFFLIAMDTTAYLDISNPQINSLIASSDFYVRKDQNHPRAVISDPNGIGQYCIFIDSRTDTDFIIEDVEWGTTFIGNSNSSDSTIGLNTFLTDGQMKIVEPRGVNFLNELAKLADPKKLNTDPATMPFMLKVIFVGHKDDGTVEQITTVPPFGIIFTDIVGSVDSNGTTYQMKYCGAINGSVWNKTYDSIVDGMHFEFTPTLNLQGHLAKFEAQINKKYLDDRQQVINNYKKATNGKVDLSNTATIEWSLNFDTTGVQKLNKLNDFGTLAPPQTKVEGKTVIYTGTKEGGVGELINNLMNSSQQWTNIQLSGNPELKDFDNISTRYAFKISTEFKKLSAKKGNKFILVYNIDEYSYRVVDIVDSASGQGNAKPPVIDPASVYTLNYIFTGKNVDIQKLDMNMSMGYALWISLITSRSLSTQTEDVAGTISRSSITQIRPFQISFDPLQALRTGTPIWPPALAKETPKKELLNDAAVASADSIWRNFASYQAIQTDVTILGNPQLIQKITNPNRGSPNYIKINVKMPSTTDDIWEYNLNSNATPGGYYKTFWFDGYYNIITAKNKFIGGQFTQDLMLIAIPEVSSDMIQSNALQAQQDYESQNPSSIYSNIAPTIPATPKLQMTPPLGKGLKPGQPTSSNLQSATPPQIYYNFVATYWNSAVNAVMSFSQDASQQVNFNIPAIDPDFILAQAALETGWGVVGHLVPYNNLTSIKAFEGNPHTFYWDGSAVTLNSGKYRVYSTPQDGLTDMARLVTIKYSDIYKSSGAAYASDITSYVYALQHLPGGGAYSEDPDYESKVIAAYNLILSAKSYLGIIGNSLYQNSVVFKTTATTPFLQSTSVPYPDAFSSVPTIYSALNRSIFTATTQQKTPMIK